MKSECKYSFLEAKAKLEALCAYQERCSFELNNKMFDWGVDSEDRGRLLAHLISYNFLNEERFSEAFCSGKVNIKKWGRIKIRQHLKQKRISDYSIKKGLNSINADTYLSNLEKLSVQKIKMVSKEKNLYAKKVKVYRFLSSKGYETDLIREVVDELLNN